MKKIKSLRTAAGVIVATLLTTCLIGGTFAKYTTGASAATNARVAYWGFGAAGVMDFEDLFKTDYNGVVVSANEDNVIAPGTSGEATFSFAYDNSEKDAPEVAYSFSVDVTGTCSEDIKDNQSITFWLDDNEPGSFDELIASLKALAGEADGSKNYEAGQLPAAFTATVNEHVIHWAWDFEDGTADQDYTDTEMASGSLGTCAISLSVTATQIQ